MSTTCIQSLIYNSRLNSIPFGMRFDQMCIETKTSMVDVPVQVVFKVGLVNMVFLFTVFALTYVLPNIGPYAKSK